MFGSPSPQKLQIKLTRLANDLDKFPFSELIIPLKQVQYGLLVSKCIKTLRKMQQFPEFEEEASSLIVSIESAIETGELTLISSLLKFNSLVR
tara:strand:- start:159 stop:437 length:279 start_codon:yes stop_codon:yes gene_type:complete